ncbi:MAG: hypothetical protein K0R47_4216 [Brevibacillus sp.]|nr:hypothetical protein [Brevibacillus sp.]
MPASRKGQGVGNMQNKLFLIAVLLSMILVPMEHPFGVRALFLQT